MLKLYALSIATFKDRASDQSFDHAVGYYFAMSEDEARGWAFAQKNSPGRSISINVKEIPLSMIRENMLVSETLITASIQTPT